ncbi:MAG: prepilin-type N-terminal cleavage/methylation domain-containing protein [Phycisphaerales bacterium]|nr:MAG: prepilin-type N-terminal cleavage/methylation domain-containing protein [Phycisphaerales bacterium]
MKSPKSDRTNSPSANGRPTVADAFTMIEVIVALAILSTTIVAIFGAMRTCSDASHHTRMLTRSVLLAESLLVQATLPQDRAFETRKGLAEPFQWKVQIAPTPVQDLGAIHVQVNWLEQHRPQQYDLFSLIPMRSLTQ